MMDLTHIARPYAKAAFEFAQAKQQLQAWYDLLLLAACLVQEPVVNTYMNDPTITEKQHYETFMSALNVKDTHQQNFLQLLVDFGRMAALPAILTEFTQFKDAYEKTMEVTVTTAMELTEQQENTIKKMLANRFNKTISLKQHQDPNLIGGVIIRADDLVIDGSVSGRIAKLREYLRGEQV